MTDNVIDIKTRKPINLVETPEGEKAQQFMRRWARAIKDGKFNDIAIIAIDDNNYCDFGVLSSSELKLALFGHLIDDVKRQILNQLFRLDEDDETED